MNWLTKATKTKDYLGKIFRFKIFLVDPKWVAKTFKDQRWVSAEPDWGSNWLNEGCNYIPKNEIWINKELKENDIYETIGHEIVEVILLEEGFGYEIAHWCAESCQKELVKFIIDKIKKEDSKRIGIVWKKYGQIIVEIRYPLERPLDIKKDFPQLEDIEKEELARGKRKEHKFIQFEIPKKYQEIVEQIVETGKEKGLNVVIKD